jgi:hypothetical protein
MYIMVEETAVNLVANLDSRFGGVAWLEDFIATD